MLDRKYLTYSLVALTGLVATVYLQYAVRLERSVNNIPEFDVSGAKFKNAITEISVDLEDADRLEILSALKNDRRAMAAIITPIFWSGDKRALARAPDAILINKDASYQWCNFTDSSIYLKYKKKTQADSRSNQSLHGSGPQ